MLANARALVRFIPDCAVLFARLVRDRCVPRRQRIALVLLGAYLASPIDLIPDFIPVAGYLDDAILVVLMLRWLRRTADAETLAERWPGPPSTLAILLRNPHDAATNGP